MKIGCFLDDVVGCGDGAMLSDPGGVVYFDSSFVVFQKLEQGELFTILVGGGMDKWHLVHITLLLLY